MANLRERPLSGSPAVYSHLSKCQPIRYQIPLRTSGNLHLHLGVLSVPQVQRHIHRNPLAVRRVAPGIKVAAADPIPIAPIHQEDIHLDPIADIEHGCRQQAQPQRAVISCEVGPDGDGSHQDRRIFLPAVPHDWGMLLKRIVRSPTGYNGKAVGEGSR